MSRSLSLKPHLSTEQLRQRMREAPDARMRARYQVVYLVSQGQSAPRVAEAVGYCANWVRSIVHRYNDEGEAGLVDGRTHNAGQAAYLSAEQQAELMVALQERHADGGLWNGPKVRRWIEEKTGRERVSAPLGWYYLQRLGYSAQRPRRRHVGAEAAAQEAFKKS